MAETKDETNAPSGTPPEGDKPTGETPKPPEPNKEPESGSGGGNDDLRSIVAEEVKKALDGLRTPGSTLPTPRARDIEEEAKRMVREAAEKLEAEKKHETDHAKLAETAEKLTEGAPKKVRRLTKALWGDED